MGCVKSKLGQSRAAETAVDEAEGHKWHGVRGESIRTSVLSEIMSVIQRGPSIDVGNNCVQIVTADIATIDSVYDGVKDGKVLGYGITGLVRLITHKETGAEYAVKSLPLDRIGDIRGLEQLKDELAILMEIDHPNIVKLEGVYESEDCIYLVQELCNGGDLFDRLDQQPEEHYSEAQCARIIKQMLSAVRYIHSKSIIHRDLKLENFLFHGHGPDAELKMIDFGLSKHFKSGEWHHEPVGTRYTVAPEVLKKTYDEKADVWAVGVITYLLLSGVAPFGGCSEDENVQDIRRRILNADYTFEPHEYWSHVSDSAKDFIAKILVVDPALRPTAEECQGHPWMKEWENREDKRGLSLEVQHALRKFRGKSEIAKLMCEVIGFTLLPDQITKLRKEFEKLDVEHNGEISLDNLKKVLIANAEKGSYAYTEDEVEDIFNSMRLHKTCTTIHWHHFLAANLSECPVDERNHRLAFDRLDKDQKGFVTLEDLVQLTGAESLNRRVSSLRQEWVQSPHYSKRISYKDFEHIMSATSEAEEDLEDSKSEAEEDLEDSKC